MRRCKSALRFVLLLLAGALVGLGIYSWNARSLTGDAVPMPFGYGVSVVLSGSMEPTLSVGDLLVVAEAETYREQDIVVYQSGRMAVVHRLVAIRGDEAITKGDANNSEDTPLSLTAIKGKVICVIPMVGYLLWGIRSPAGILTILVLAVLLMEGSYQNEKKEKAREQEAIKAEICQLLQELREDDGE